MRHHGICRYGDIRADNMAILAHSSIDMRHDRVTENRRRGSYSGSLQSDLDLIILPALVRRICACPCHDLFTVGAPRVFILPAWAYILQLQLGQRKNPVDSGPCQKLGWFVI